MKKIRSLAQHKDDGFSLLGDQDSDFSILSAQSSPERTGANPTDGAQGLLDVGASSQWTTGVSSLLANLQTGLSTVLLHNNIPLLGDQLGDAATFVSTLRTAFVNASASFSSASLAALDNSLTSFFSSQNVLIGTGAAGTDDDVVLSVKENGTWKTLTSANYTDGSVNLAQVTDLRVDLTLGKTHTASGLGFDLGLDGLGVNFQGDSSISASLDWQLNLGFGVDLARNEFYVVTDKANELSVDVSAALPAGFEAVGTMGLLQIELAEQAGGPATGVSGSADLNLTAHSTGASDRLYLADFGTILTGAACTYDINAAVDLGATLASHFTAVAGGFTPDSEFPTLSADVDFDWHVTSSSGGAAPEFALRNITLNFGDFVGDVALPLLEQIDAAFDAIRPLLDHLQSPVPLLSLTPEQPYAGATYLDLIGLLGGNVGAFQSFVAAVDTVHDLVEAAHAAIGSGSVSLGDVVFSAGVDLRNLGALTSPNFTQLFAELNSSSAVLSQIQAIGAAAGGLSGSTFLSSTASGFSFPVFNNPASLLGMLFGQNADLLHFVAPHVDLSFDWHADGFGPVQLGPIPVYFRVDGGFHLLADFAAGYDTQGLVAFAASGIYLDVAGTNLALSGSLGLTGYVGAEFAGVGLTSGVTGQLVADILVNLADPDGDGRVSGDDIAAALDAGNVASLFDFDGKLSAEVNAFLKLDLWLYEHTWTQQLYQTVLLDLSNLELNLATLQSDGTLHLNIGADADARGANDPNIGAEYTTDIGEQYTVEYVANGQVKVTAFGVSQIFGAGSIKVARIVGDAGAGNDIILIDPGLKTASGAALSVVLNGGAGADTLQGGDAGDTLNGDDGNDYIAGGAGNDLIAGGAGEDIVIGEDGDDRIAISNAADQVNGGANFNTIDLSASSVSAEIDLTNNTINGALVQTPTFGSDIMAASANTGADETAPVVTALVGGGFVVTWISGTLDTDIRGRIFDANGAPVGNELSLAPTSNDQLTPDIVALSTGGFVVVYDNAEQELGARRFNAAGVQVGLYIQIAVDNLSFDVLRPSVAAFTGGGRDGWFVVVYERETLNSSNNILGVVYDANGNMWDTFNVDTSSNAQVNPDVSVLSDGTFVVAYTNNNANGSDTPIVYRVCTLGSGGVSVGSAITASATAGTQAPGDAQTLALSGNHFVLAWTDPQADGSGTSVVMRMYANGVASSEAMVVATTTAGSQNQPTLTALNDGGFLVFWNDDSNAIGGHTPLRGQRFDANGARVGEEFLIVVEGEEANPSAAHLTSSGEVVLVLQETLNGDTSIRSVLLNSESANVLASISGVVGTAQADTITGNANANTLSGLAGVDHLDGATGNDTLNGGTGADAMIGGDGIDTASYATAANAVTVNLSTGVATGSDALGDTFDSIENLTGSNFNDRLTGNSFANRLSGAAGNDTLNGGFGNDTMIGGTGDDTYVVNAAGDATTEASAGGGTDLVQSSVTRTLGTNLENLTLTGSLAINGIGNSLANILTGNSFANVLTGGDGADTLKGGPGGDKLNGGTGLDTLTGGNGNDKFVFNTAPAAANRDAITDYNVAADTILLEKDVFAGLGALGVLVAGKFYIGANAHDASDRIIYDSANGKLYFDADGSGAGAKIWFATLDAGLALTAADFAVI